LRFDNLNYYLLFSQIDIETRIKIGIVIYFKIVIEHHNRVPLLLYSRISFFSFLKTPIGIVFKIS
jgi:hypothetical protein